MNSDENFNNLHPLSNIDQNDPDDVYSLHKTMKLLDAEKFMEVMEKEMFDHERGKH